MMGDKYTTLGHSQLKACSVVVLTFFFSTLHVTTTEQENETKVSHSHRDTLLSCLILSFL